MMMNGYSTTRRRRRVSSSSSPTRTILAFVLVWVSRPTEIQAFQSSNTYYTTSNNKSLNRRPQSLVLLYSSSSGSSSPSSSSSSYSDDQPDDWSCTVLDEGSDMEEEYCFLNDSIEDPNKSPLSYYHEDNCQLVKRRRDIFDDNNKQQLEDESLSTVFSSSSFWDKALQSKPIILTGLAFGTYDPMANLFSSCLQFLEGFQNNWVSVDGGAYQAKIIAPAINGVIIPAMALVFANMIAITINTLKQRQLAIQLAMHMEAVQLRILSTCLDDEHNSGVVVRTTTEDATRTHTTTILSPDERSVAKCQQYLWQYASRLISEADETVPVNQLAMESELNGVVHELYRLVVLVDDQQHSSPSSNNKKQLSHMVWNQAMNACQLLTEHRAKRITALQSTFPPLHFAVLAALGGSILLAFLMETNQDILVFLNAIQLRLLWSILVGTLSVLGLVCFDLSQPFRGSYQISKRSSMMDQLSTIRQGLFLNLNNNNNKRQEQQETEAIVQEKNRL